MREKRRQLSCSGTSTMRQRGTSRPPMPGEHRCLGPDYTISVPGRKLPGFLLSIQKRTAPGCRRVKPRRSSIESAAPARHAGAAPGLRPWCRAHRPPPPGITPGVGAEPVQGPGPAASPARSGTCRRGQRAARRPTPRLPGGGRRSCPSGWPSGSGFPSRDSPCPRPCAPCRRSFRQRECSW